MDPASFEFARPAWLFAGLALCVLAAGLWVWFDRRREADLSRLVHARFRARLLPGISRGLQWTKRGLWLGGALLLCTAAAGPRMGYEWRDVRQRGIDLLFAVDTSRSMLAEDLSPNRLERARMGIQDFVERLHGDRVGLIPFAGSSYTMCPLTTDYDAFHQALRTLTTDLIPRQGTDVASAIREAKRLFDEQKHNHRILVLMTDGEDFQDDVDVAVAEAKKDGMMIYTVGVGSTEGAQIPVETAAGYKDFVRDEQGQIVVTKLGESTLRKISEETGGLYAPLGRGAEGLEMIYKEKLRLMPKEERERGMERVPLERFRWPLAAGLLLLLVEFLLPDRRRETRAKALPSAARRHATALLLVLLGCGFANQAGAEEDPRVLYNEGTAAYEANDFKTAAEKLKASLKTDLGLQNKAYYNLGNALYQQSKKTESGEDALKLMEEAKKAYADASALDPSDEDARHNQKVVEKKIEDAKKKKDGQGGEGGEDGDSKDGEKGKDGKDGKNDKNSDGQKDQKDQKDKQEQKGDGKDANQDQQGDQSQQDQKDGKQKDQGDQKQEGQPGEKKEGQDQKDPSGGGAGEEQKEKKKEEQTNGNGGEKKEQPNGGGEEKKQEDQANGGASQDEKKDSEKKEGQEGSSQQAGGEKKEGERKEGAQTQTPGETQNGDQKNAQEVQQGTLGERRKPGEMTAEEARQLLKTMRVQEATVLPFQPLTPRQRRYANPNSSTKGKTW